MLSKITLSNERRCIGGWPGIAVAEGSNAMLLKRSTEQFKTLAFSGMSVISFKSGIHFISSHLQEKQTSVKTGSGSAILKNEDTLRGRGFRSTSLSMFPYRTTFDARLVFSALLSLVSSPQVVARMSSSTSVRHTTPLTPQIYATGFSMLLGRFSFISVSGLGAYTGLQQSPKHTSSSAHPVKS